MAEFVERRKTRRDRRAPAKASTGGMAPGGAGQQRRRLRYVPVAPDLVTLENERLRRELLEHIERLKQANKELVISGINAQVLADQLRSAKAEMTHLAHHDHLTTLPNRIQFKKLLAKTLVQSGVHGTKLALLFIDLDRFKVVNDSLGHSVGDQLLQAVALRLSAAVRGSDTVSRQGGDEFVAMLADVQHTEDVAARVQHIHRLVTAPYHIAHHVLQIGASVGIAIFPDDAADLESLMRSADIAMYAVKEQGRNAFAFFEQAMNVRAKARHQMETSLREALERQQFVLEYQAQVDLHTRRVVGAEALLRWRHPDDGYLLPGAFIGLAEECGMIKAIDCWVLGEACRQARCWLDAGCALESISVNISAQEFECDEFLGTVFAALAKTGLPPACLELELTEGTMMRDSTATIKKLQRLREAGIRIAIDDFGTGYSSLGYLRRFPIDTLKIDQSFVADIAPGATEVLVDAVIDIGNRMHHHVIAEGIESAEQVAYLRNHACATGQGFYLAAPMAAEEFGRVLARAD